MPKLPHDFDPHNFKMLQDAAREHVAEEVRDELRAERHDEIRSEGIMDGRERMEALLRKRGGHIAGARPSHAPDADSRTNLGFCQAHRIGLAESACAGLEDVAVTIDNNVWLLCLAHAQPIFKKDVR